MQAHCEMHLTTIWQLGCKEAMLLYCHPHHSKIDSVTAKCQSCHTAPILQLQTHFPPIMLPFYLIPSSFMWEKGKKYCHAIPIYGALKAKTRPVRWLMTHVRKKFKAFLRNIVQCNGSKLLITVLYPTLVKFGNKLWYNMSVSIIQSPQQTRSLSNVFSPVKVSRTTCKLSLKPSFSDSLTM